jgi:hypothetical protein
MYAIKISIDPQTGVKDVALQVTDRHKGSIEPMQFYLAVRKDIQKFKRSVAKTLKGEGLDFK